MDTVEKDGQNVSEGHKRREQTQRDQESEPALCLSQSLFWSTVSVQAHQTVNHCCVAKSVVPNLGGGGHKMIVKGP